MQRSSSIIGTHALGPSGSETVSRTARRRAITPLPREDLLTTPRGRVLPEPRPARVLLAEDDDEMRSLLVEAFERDGFEVVQAANGTQLLTRLAQAHRMGDTVDVVVTDVRMPGLGGLEALAMLRRAGCREAVIVITAFGDASTHLQADRLGAWAVLDKPFDFEMLRALVRDLWRRRRRPWLPDKPRDQ